MLSLAHRGLLAATTALIAAGVIAQSADAASCARSGYKIVRSDPHTAILEREVRGRSWEEGPTRLYACSARFGRFVPLGSHGISPDGPVDVSVHDINDRYVASSIRWSDNGDGDELGGAITVRDLKTRKRLYTATGVATAGPFSPSRVALGDTGDLGWIEQPLGKPNEVWMRERSGVEPVKVASGASIDQRFLRWSTDGARLVWADPARALAYLPRKKRDSDPLHGGRCTRSGDRILGRGHGYVYLSRAFNTPEWSRGSRVLIACSLRYKRRVALAHSGRFDGKKFTYEVPTVREAFAASVFRQTDEDGDGRTFMIVHDLGREERLCLTDAAEKLEDVSVPAVRIDETGSAVWTATGRVVGKATKQTQVRVCDAGPVRTLASGVGIDPLLIRLDPDTQSVLFAGRAGTEFSRP